MLVFGVLPWIIGIIGALFFGYYLDSMIKEMAAKTTLGRIGKPEDIAKVALFLASINSDFITGQVIVVDGGIVDYLTHSM
ncbi:MAG: SDR family oxidoreductase [Candidatus Marsarchaeota archaeon]|nr:SDR family oxidoreductase [Candidatus Marsarchaeota archaeon]MCL5418736.1 SDR family oxidoreductase [Candidatus Marsarchaeota archaeon]